MSRMHLVAGALAAMAIGFYFVATECRSSVNVPIYNGDWPGRGVVMDAYHQISLGSAVGGWDANETTITAGGATGIQTINIDSVIYTYDTGTGFYVNGSVAYDITTDGGDGFPTHYVKRIDDESVEEGVIAFIN